MASKTASLRMLHQCMEELVENLKQDYSNNKSCDLQVMKLDLNGFDNETKSTRQLISNETEQLLILYIIIAFIVTSLCGVLGNSINIIVYWKQGINSSVNLGFFALSISDLILVCMPLFRGCLYAAEYENPNSSVHFSSLHYVTSGWTRNFAYSTSCLITTFLSIERCCCIILPFKVQTIFTRKRTAIFLFVMSFFHAVCLLCLPIAVQLRWRQVGPDNSTQKLLIWFSDYGLDIEMVYTMIFSFVLPVGTQAIITICAFIMIRGLRRSSKFRAKLTGANNKSSSSSPNDEEKQAQHSLSPRDARLVKTMVFLVIIFSACNAPFLVITFAWRLVPGLSIGGTYQNMLSLLFSIAYVLGNINATSNTIVYYKSSSRFREVTKEVFCAANQDKQKQTVSI